MAAADEGSRSADLMARMLKEWQEINEAQNLQDSMRADLQKIREQARQRLIANQKRLEQIKSGISNLYKLESQRLVLCDILNPVDIDAAKQQILMQQNKEAKEKAKAARNEQVRMCLKKMAQHDKALEMFQLSKAKESALQQVKASEAEISNLERKIAGFSASTRMATANIAKLHQDLTEAEKTKAVTDTARTDHEAELKSWVDQEKDIVSAILRDCRLSDSESSEFLTAGIQWLQNQTMLKTKELQSLAEMVQQRQNELKLLQK